MDLPSVILRSSNNVGGNNYQAFVVAAHSRSGKPANFGLNSSVVTVLVEASGCAGAALSALLRRRRRSRRRGRRGRRDGGGRRWTRAEEISALLGVNVTVRFRLASSPAGRRRNLTDPSSSPSSSRHLGNLSCGRLELGSATDVLLSAKKRRQA